MDRFPDSLIAFQRMFPHDDACAAWLASVRWPEGFECPRCGSRLGARGATPHMSEQRCHGPCRHARYSCRLPDSVAGRAVARRFEVGAATRRAACAWPRSRPTAPKASTASSATTSPRPTAGPATPRPPSRPTIPTSSVPWPPTSCCPGSIRCSPISRAGRAASITGWRAKHLRYLDEFVFRFNRRRTRHAAFRSLFGIAVCTKPFTYNMLVRPEAGA